MERSFKLAIDFNILRALDHSPAELLILDKKGRIIYINKTCEKNYGLKQEEMIGRYNAELVAEGYWTNTLIPYVFKEKKPAQGVQKTYLGNEVITISIPIFNNENEIECIISTTLETDFHSFFFQKERIAYSTDNKAIDNTMITNNDEMRNLIKLCEKIAKVDSTVLIQGESGTGKTMLAKYIHNMSKRKGGPFLSLNCATLPEDLLESELFGYTPGAFTGANRNGKKGLLEAANEGTLFLDEIGEISPKVQAKLLQVIQEQAFLPIGGREIKKVNIRIITATNKDLYGMVEKGTFREDLFYRIHVVDLLLPPLRKRKDDIIPLTYYFLNKLNKRYEVNRTLSQEALDTLINYDWPGNIRQLENVLERTIITSEYIIQASDLPAYVFKEAFNKQKSTLIRDHPTTLSDGINEVKKQMILNSYNKYKSSRKVAEDLKISQSTATRLIKRYCRDH